MTDLSRADTETVAETVTESDEADLAALVGARICHDLVSPLGAIGNGFELLDATQPHLPELDLIGDSVNLALARIRLMRLAFGAAGPDRPLSAAEAGAALSGIGAGGRIETVIDLPEWLARSDAQLLALLALCCEGALAWGGRLDIGARGTALWLTARAERLNLDPALWPALAAGQSPDTPAPGAVQFALAPRRLARAGRQLRIEMQPGLLRLDL